MTEIVKALCELLSKMIHEEAARASEETVRKLRCSRQDYSELKEVIESMRIQLAQIQSTPEGKRPGVRTSARDIRFLRKRLKISQEQLARLLSVSRRTVSRWEQGERRPLSSTKAKIIQLKKTPPAEIWEILQQIEQEDMA